MNHNAIITRGARSIASLAPAVSGMDRLRQELADIERASVRGYFTPDEDERVRVRFAQYLAARAGLLQTIDELRPIATSEDQCIDEATRLKAFVIAYTAAALLVKAARFIVDHYAPNTIVQRKLNEAEPRYGIPRKQYTAVYRSLTSPRQAWRMYDAITFVQSHQPMMDSLAGDPEMAIVLGHMHGAQEAVNLDVGHLVKSRLRYRWHAWRRRRASAFGQVMFSLMEWGGRIVADIHNPWHTHRITPEVRDEITSLLKPGDVLISRHDDAMSNLFLPGYWCHAALHIGSESARRELAIQVDPDRAARWVEPIRTLEAKKDGVLFRALDETLAVDSVAVLRPTLDQRDLARALSQAVTHEGKLYDFELDFFRSDRMVCTEVVYRAYHGIGPLQFQLKQRAGRPTLAAEDVLDMALQGGGLEPVAVFGSPGAERDVVTGAQAWQVLANGRNMREHA